MKILPMILVPFVFFILASCQNGYVGHIAGARLVTVQKIPMAENKFDENFRAMLELLYPYECHDTAFIQDQVFLERIDPDVPFKREFVIPPTLLRDFFGSNNPDKKRALREDLFFLGDSSFEKKTDRQFFTDSRVTKQDQYRLIGAYLLRNRKNALVYLVSNDTSGKTCEIGGVDRKIHNDLAKLNCTIVSDLRKKSSEELLHTTVILVVIPPEVKDTMKNKPEPKASSGVIRRKDYRQGTGARCPADSVVSKMNKQRNSVIREFRNLLHYIATTITDETLKRTYREDAAREIYKIPGVSIEGIPDNDLGKFLNSGFSRNVLVTPVSDPCNLIVGIRITQQ